MVGTIGTRAGSTWGAGFQNAIAISDPADGHTAGIIVTGGDTAGTTVSFDMGDTWQAANRGRTDLWQAKIAGMAFDPFTSNRVWCYGSNGSSESGSFKANIMWGAVDPAAKTIVWTLKYDSTTQTALGVARVGGDNHPRQAGRMIAMDPFTANRAYVATNAGVILCTATTAAVKFRASDWFTSVCIGPESTASNTVVYASAKNNVDAGGTVVSSTPNPGITKATFQGPGQTSALTTMGGTNAPTTPWEVKAVNEGGTTVLYVADGANGIKKHDGSSWSVVYAPVAGVVFKSIDAVRVGGATKVIAGHSGPNTTSGSKMIESTNGGSTWTTLTNAMVTTVVAGTNETSWLYDQRPSLALGQSQNGYDASMVLFRPDDSTTRVTCGRSGLWRRVGAGQWQPIVQGFGASVGLNVEADPTHPTRVAAGDVDWKCLASDGYFAGKPTINDPQTDNVHSVSWDSDGGLYISFGDRDSVTNGEVWYNPAPPPWGSGSWSNMGLRADVGGNTFRTLGVLYLPNAAGAPVLLVVNGTPNAASAGIWRKVGTRDASGNPVWAGATWSRRAPGPGNGLQQSNAIRLSLKTDGSGNVYCYDPLSGLWRSGDYGATWANIFPKTTTAGNRNASDIELTPTGLLYLTTFTQVWRITNPQSGTLSAAGATASGTIAATDVTGTLPATGPVATDGASRVYVAATADGGTCGLYMSANDGATWNDLSDAAWRGLALFPISIDVSTDGTRLYAALDGLGYAVAKLS